MDAKTMRKVADNIRILEAAMVEKAKSGHPGGSMSGTDYVNTLYSKYIVYDPDDAKWFARDRFSWIPDTCRRCFMAFWLCVVNSR